MNLTKGQLKGFLFAFECVGAVFVGLFLSVYVLALRELPATPVYHSDPIFRTLLSVFGVALLVLVLVAVLLAVLVKKKM